MLPDEHQLAQAVTRGDSVALGKLLSLHQKRLYNVALRMVGNRDDAAEVAQDAMVKIIEHIDDFKGQSQVGTWMVRIVMNLSISHLRKRKLRQTVSLDGQASAGSPGHNGQEPVAPLREQLASHEPNPVSRVQQREMHALLARALGLIEEDFRAVIVLRDINEMDYQQIAQVLGVPVGTVKSRLFRARLALRHQMLRLAPPASSPASSKESADG